VGRRVTDAMQRFYTDAYDEDARLHVRPSGRLEARRTRELLRRCLPAPPAEVLDVGGATGAHAVWLVEAGYRVRIFDVVASHVDAARAAGLDAAVGDARHLDVQAASVDVVLLLGPLYHLTAAVDRSAALAEAVRVLRPGGVVAAAAISRWAGLLDLGTSGPWGRDTTDRLTEVVDTGRHDPTLGFTTAYLHRPDELGDELRQAGLGDVEVLAIEGPMGRAVDLVEDTEAAIDRAVEVAAMVEAEPALLGASPHLLAVGRR
jgi:SAM-dependent methyltransferase